MRHERETPIGPLRGLPSLGFALLLLLLLGAGIGLERPEEEAEPEPVPVELAASEIARRAEDVLRSDRTYMEATMKVVSRRAGKPQVVSFRYWRDRVKRRVLVHILEPSKAAGTLFLWLPPNLWTYVPRDETTARISPSTMHEPWMGSDFTSDDIFDASSRVEDFEHRRVGIEESPEGHEDLRAYVLEYTPREGAPVVWGRIVAWIDAEHFTPLRRDFYDADGMMRRSLRFADIREVEGRRVPHLWIMKSLREKGHETRLKLERIDFDAVFDDEVFTTRNLYKP